jgi:NAD(P)-dependent dehydrogenase (short-subunit alcohol dehydrogenase family)
MIQKALDEYGKLYNVAGIFDKMASVENTTNEVFERVMNVNLHGQFYSSRKAVQEFKNKKLEEQ